MRHILDFDDTRLGGRHLTGTLGTVAAAGSARARSGSIGEAQIAHATGTVSHPLSDQALVDKRLGNATPAIGAEPARTIVDIIWKLDSLSDVADLVRACA